MTGPLKRREKVDCRRGQGLHVFLGMNPSLSPVIQSVRLNERLHRRLPGRRLDFLQLAVWPDILVSTYRPSVFLDGVLVPVQHVVRSSSQTMDPVKLIHESSGGFC